MKKAAMITSTMSALVFGLAACASYDTANPTMTSHAPQAAMCGGDAVSDESNSVLTPDRIVETRTLYEYWGRPRLRQTSGVEMLVVANEGESEAWVERVVQCEAASRSGIDDLHPLGVEGLNIAVERRGAYFVVKLTGESHGKSLEIAQRAEHFSARG